MTHHFKHIAIIVCLLTILCLSTDRLAAQSVGISVTRSVTGPHPAIVSQRVRMLDLEYRRAKQGWRREAREQRRNDLRERLHRRLEAWRLVVENRREQRRRQAARYAHLIDDRIGYIAWPELLALNYPLEVDELNRLFEDWAVGDGGVGSANYRQIQQCTRKLKQKLKRSLSRKDRMSAREYTHLLGLISVVSNTAGRPPSSVRIANDIRDDEAR